MTRLADRQIEIVLRNKVYFGVGAIARLPEVVAAAGGSRVFVVTDPGVRASGVIDRALAVLTEAGVEHALFDEVEPNPAASTVERGATALRAFGLEGTVIVPIGGGSSMDTAKALDLRAANEPAHGVGARVRRRRRWHPGVRSSRSRRPRAPAPRPIRSGSSPTRWSAARATSAIRRCSPSRRSWIRR